MTWVATRAWRRRAAVATLLLCAGCGIDVNEAKLLQADARPTPIDLVALRAVVAPGVRIEPVELRAGDGVALRGIHLIVPGARATVVYFSGNPMRLSERGPVLLPRFAALGVDLLWLDYRGIGASDGQPRIALLERDATAALDLAAGYGKPVVVHGLSMGSVLAGHVARDPRVAGLVLEGAITTIEEVSDITMPGWVKPFIHARFAPEIQAVDNVAPLRRYHGPLLLITGAEDRETPPVLARHLFAATAAQPRELVIIEAADHASAMASPAVSPPYRRLLAAALARGT